MADITARSSIAVVVGDSTVLVEVDVATKQDGNEAEPALLVSEITNAVVLFLKENYGA
jgi:hypothetical protein